jgi:hypothetical protein
MKYPRNTDRILAHAKLPLNKRVTTTKGNLMFAFALLVLSLVCLGFDSTKLVGFVGMTLLFYLYPPLLIAFLILGGVGLIFIHNQ